MSAKHHNNELSLDAAIVAKQLCTQQSQVWHCPVAFPLLGALASPLRVELKTHPRFLELRLVYTFDLLPAPGPDPLGNHQLCKRVYLSACQPPHLYHRTCGHASLQKQPPQFLAQRQAATAVEHCRLRCQSCCQPASVPTRLSTTRDATGHKALMPGVTPLKYASPPSPQWQQPADL